MHATLKNWGCELTAIHCTLYAYIDKCALSMHVTMVGIRTGPGPTGANHPMWEKPGEFPSPDGSSYPEHYSCVCVETPIPPTMNDRELNYHVVYSQQ